MYKREPALPRRLAFWVLTTINTKYVVCGSDDQIGARAVALGRSGRWLKTKQINAPFSIIIYLLIN